MPPDSPARLSAARERLLRAAADLFYREGINGVGVDQVLSAAGVTRATMYRHFPSKQALVIAYLDLEDAGLQHLFADAAREATAAGADSPRELLAAVIEGIASDAAFLHTRGCPFINASAEFPDPDGPVRRVVARHRTWFRETLESLTAAAGVHDPRAAAAGLVLLRDAMLVGGYLDGVDVADDFRREARRSVGLETT